MLKGNPRIPQGLAVFWKKKGLKMEAEKKKWWKLRRTRRQKAAMK